MAGRSSSPPDMSQHQQQEVAGNTSTGLDGERVTDPQSKAMEPQGEGEKEKDDGGNGDSSAEAASSTALQALYHRKRRKIGPASPAARRSSLETISKNFDAAKSYDESFEKMLAMELGQLDAADRDAAELDLHGIPAKFEETPDLVDRSLAEMKAAISGLLEKDESVASSLGSAYQLAMRRDEGYVTSQKLWMSILRSTRFKPEPAAAKLLELFKIKLEIFGDDSLTKDITIQDHFDESDRKCLESGWMQCSIPATDRAGRIIIWHIPPLRSNHSHTNKVKTMFYIMDKVSRDEGCQKRGCVFVILNVGKAGQNEHFLKGLQASNSISQTMPIRFEGYHLCSDTVARKDWNTMALAKASNEHRIRSRQHYGSLDDIKSKLQTFGIPCIDETFPVRASDDFPLSKHRSWIQEQLGIENPHTMVPHQQANDSPGDIVAKPNEKDILFGRSLHAKNNPGNVRFHTMLDEMEVTYNGLTDSLDKSRISTQIVQTLKDEGSRFLKLTAGNWIVQSDLVCREKVACTFRDRRKREKKRRAKEEA